MNNRILYLLLAMLLLPFNMLNCYAVETVATNDVFITVNYAPAEGEYSTEAYNGRYTVPLDNGIIFTVTQNNTNDEYILVVYAIPENDTEAYKWFESCTVDYGDERKYFDIYFIDGNGNRVELKDCDISMELPHGYDNPKMAVLTKDSELISFDYTLEESAIKFTSSTTGYYVLADTTATKPDIPQTGNTGFASLLVLLTITLICVVALLFKYPKARQLKQ